MVFDIVQVGDPVLRQPARPLSADEIPTPFVQELIASMRQTMYAAAGVGLAAPQVGESLQVVVMEDGGDAMTLMSPARREELGRARLPFTVLVNPVVEPLGEETTEFFEGCLSLAGFSGLVRRSRSVRVRGLDATGRAVEMELDGWPARIVQHEADHLAGTLYVDRMDSRSFTTSQNLGRYWKARPAELVHDAIGRRGRSTPDPSITGFSHVSFSVVDRARSTAWYRDVLGFEVSSEVEGDGFLRTRLRRAGSGVTITLTEHENRSGDRFAEVRTGLDHLSLGVPGMADLQAWKRRFETQGVDHSEVKPTGGGGMITFRDPDNIQLELFAPGPGT